MVDCQILHRAGRAVRKLVPVLLALAAAAPPAQAATMMKFFGRSTIFISGPLQLDDDDKFAGMVDDKVERIVISSTQGSEPAALNMGRLIRSKHINVEVSRVCTGVCAQYIFIAGAKRTIWKGAVVGLQAGVVPLLRLTVADLQSATPLSEQEAEWKQALVQRYSGMLASQGGAKVAFEREIGLDNGIVSLFEAVTAPRSVNTSAVTAQSFQLKFHKGLCDVWVPDWEGWRALGVPVVNFERPHIDAIAKKLDTQVRRVSIASVPLPGLDAGWCENQASPVEQELPTATVQIVQAKARPL